MPSKLNFTTEQVGELTCAYIGGDTQGEIAQRFGVSHHGIRNCLVRNGVALPGKGKRSWYSNPVAFDVITEESAYWIGFLMADGSITDDDRICVELSAIDREHLEKLRQFVSARCPVDTHERGGYARRMTSIFRFTSIPIARTLEKYGVCPRKTSRERVVLLEDNRHFWRGVIDGDGTIVINKDNSVKLSLCGGKELLTQFVRFIGADAHWYQMGKIYAITFSREQSVKAIHTLYGGCSIALQRKNERAQEVITRGTLLHKERPRGIDGRYVIEQGKYIGHAKSVYAELMEDY